MPAMRIPSTTSVETTTVDLEEGGVSFGRAPGSPPAALSFSRTVAPGPAPSRCAGRRRRKAVVPGRFCSLAAFFLFWFPTCSGIFAASPAPDPSLAFPPPSASAALGDPKPDCLRSLVRSLLPPAQVPLRLTVIDTPGFGMGIDNSKWLVPLAYPRRHVLT